MIKASCAVCGNLFDAGEDIRCPACRAAAVWYSFRPVDPERTAKAIQQLHRLEMTNLDSPEVIAKLWQGLTWGQAQTEGMSLEEYSWGKGVAGLSETDDPKGLRMPKDEAGQCYELRRLFRL